MNKRNNADKSRLYFKVSALLFACTLSVALFCIFSRQFSEYYCRTVSAFMRYLISALTGVFPFSLAELLLFLIPLALPLPVVSVIRKGFELKRFTSAATLFFNSSIVFIR